MALLVVALLMTGWCTGWRVNTMTTPSMGERAPVGALIVSRPTSIAQVKVGDVIAFHPPGRPGTTFVHRVHSLDKGVNGLEVRTKGDINGSPDPWVLTSQNPLRRLMLAVPAAGFMLQLLPMLLLGTFLIALLTMGVRPRLRAPARIMTGSLLCTALVMYYRPLARVALIGQVADASGGTAAVVPTGVLPLRVHAVGGTHADLVPGQVGTVNMEKLLPGGAFRIDAAPHLSGWWWLVVATWGVPLLLGVMSPGRPASRLRTA